MGALVHVSAGDELVPESLHGGVVPLLGRAEEGSVRDVGAVREVAEAQGDLVAELLLAPSRLCGSLLDLEPVLVRPGEEHDLAPRLAETREAGKRVGEDDGMEVPDVWGW